ncbi:unnamed protein product [Cyprideis torosa]|uniref:Uncharacterized protein n=1 Tax=Cyprideis torosa TaxID=163714 RepID=A0A7R8ZT22_9CRUS|nr:unnamed protein product [Cyprideis torosa]CAG0903026.1 unnamed protein product [Cyprideis torosa]
MEEDSTNGNITGLPDPAFAERNRQRALALRRGKLVPKSLTGVRSQTQPYPTASSHINSGDDDIQSARHSTDRIVRVANTKYLDTGGGFLLEDADSAGKSLKDSTDVSQKVVHEPAAIIEEDRPPCKECSVPIAKSYLLNTFDFPVCDGCRDRTKHGMITKTDAKSVFLLKDSHFDRWEPPLKSILKPNPHNSRWGEMKLFLLPQVEQRAIEVWGSEEKLEEAREEREEKRNKAKHRKFERNMKALRKNVRSSLYKVEPQKHEHVYGEEIYDENDDVYRRKCTGCSLIQEYEKM